MKYKQCVTEFTTEKWTTRTKTRKHLLHTLNCTVKNVIYIKPSYYSLCNLKITVFAQNLNVVIYFVHDAGIECCKISLFVMFLYRYLNKMIKIYFY